MKISDIPPFLTSYFTKERIIDKNLIIFYVNCDSLQLHFFKNICIVLFLTFLAWVFPLFLFVYLLISLNFSKTLHNIQIFNPDAFTFLTTCRRPSHWLKQCLADLCNAFFSAFLSSVSVCWINSWLWCNCFRTASFKCINWICIQIK